MKIRSLLMLLLAMSMLISCSSHDEPTPENDVKKQTMLIYAVASNNLYPDLRSDSLEILQAAENLNLKECALYMYKVTPTGNPMLLKLQKDGAGEPSFVEVKVYDRNLFSTDPKRLKSVIADVKAYSPSETYGLVMWSHATGWQYDKTDHQVPGMSYSFGADKYHGVTDHCNIDELAEAIPSSTFSYIWFDACYMGQAEVAYQLRDKADYMVGAVSEIWDEGNPYHLTLPYMLRATPDLAKAADIFYNYYVGKQMPVTMAVIDLKEMEGVAAACRNINSHNLEVDASVLQNYARGSNGPFYDVYQLSAERAQGNTELIEPLRNALEKAVVYKAISETDFRGNPFDASVYSGLSCRNYQPNDFNETDGFYRTLDWALKTYADYLK